MRTSSLTSLLLVLTLACSDKGAIIDTNTGDSGSNDTADLTVDLDGDGWTVGDGDCNDENEAIFPGAVEDCDGIDNNCNEVVDEGFSNLDGDELADCVDVEECDGVDNDGDGQVDEGFEDVDGDGLSDCIDAEDCDGIDNNGDGQIDEGFDADGDGFSTCNATGDVIVDCDDNDASANPDGAEVTGNGKDDDCDGLIDEDDSVYTEGVVVFSEVLNNPNAVADTRGEWFEVYNPERKMYFSMGWLSQTWMVWKRIALSVQFR